MSRVCSVSAIRDKLFRFMLTDWQRIKAEYDAIGAENITRLKKRELQLWRPLLAIARILGSDVEKELLSIATHQQELNRAEEIAEGSWEYLLLERAYRLIKGGQRILYLAELADAIPLEERPRNNKTISRILDGLGFRDFERVREPGKNRRAGYRISSLEDFERLLGTLNPSFFSSFSSDSSDNRGEETIEEDAKTEESRRKVNDIGGKTPEETEESAESEGVSDMKNPLEPFFFTAKNGEVYPIEAIAGLCDLTLPEAPRRGLILRRPRWPDPVQGQGGPGAESPGAH